MSTRKRRRQEAFEEQKAETPPPVKTEEEIAQARTEKEQEIWDSVREAHYEAIEQLPLTLQRQLSLMRQLDEQTSTSGARILPTLQRYIELRRRLEGKEAVREGPAEQVQPPSPTASSKSANPNGQTQGDSIGSLVTPLRRLRTSETIPSVRNSTPMSLSSERQKSESSRDIIRNLAFMSEELLRASQEKVNLAQANYDSVERHIHLLDQAIKEQEASLSADPSKAIHIHLPELVIPKYHRGGRVEQRLGEDELDEELESINETGTSIVEEPGSTNKRSSKRKGKDGSVKQKGVSGKVSSALTITLPAAQPNDEPLYCYCNRVSFGEMIACDNTSCEREWFHLGCVGLTEPPEGEWFCEDCKSDEG